jgi:hypothetical protein
MLTQTEKTFEINHDLIRRFERYFLLLEQIANRSVDNCSKTQSSPTLDKPPRDASDKLQLGKILKLLNQLPSLARESSQEFRLWFQKLLSSPLQLQYGTDVEIMSKTIDYCGTCAITFNFTLQASTLQTFINLFSDEESADVLNPVFYGLRYLAEKNCIDWDQTFGSLFNLFEKMMASFNYKLSTKIICFRAIGVLANRGHFSDRDKISAKNIEQLLDKFSEYYLFTEIEKSYHFLVALEIESIFLGLWHLSVKNNINGRISAKSIDNLLVIFKRVEPGEKLENVLCALEYLTVGENIDGEVDSNITFFNDASNSICHLPKTISIGEQLTPPLMRHFVADPKSTFNFYRKGRQELRFTDYYIGCDLYYDSIRKKDLSDKKLEQVWGPFCSFLAKNMANNHFSINFFYKFLHSQAEDAARGWTAESAKSMLCHAFPYAKNSMIFFRMPLNPDVKKLVFENLIDLLAEEETARSKSFTPK